MFRCRHLRRCCCNDFANLQLATRGREGTKGAILWRAGKKLKKMGSRQGANDFLTCGQGGTTSFTAFVAWHGTSDLFNAPPLINYANRDPSQELIVGGGRRHHKLGWARQLQHEPIAIMECKRQFNTNCLN